MNADEQAEAVWDGTGPDREDAVRERQAIERGAAPVPSGRPDGPHSRACGWQPHDHGSACHANCPTCHGRPPAADVQPSEAGRPIKRNGKTLRWCTTHDEPAWAYDDGSVSCPYDLIIESNTDHELTDGPWLAATPSPAEPEGDAEDMSDPHGPMSAAPAAPPADEPDEQRHADGVTGEPEWGTRPETQPPAAVVPDLMEALRQSVDRAKADRRRVWVCAIPEADGPCSASDQHAPGYGCAYGTATTPPAPPAASPVPAERRCTCGHLESVHTISGVFRGGCMDDPIQPKNCGCEWFTPPAPTGTDGDPT